MIRPATLADAAEIRTLLADLGYAHSDAETFERTFAGLFVDSRSRVLVATSGGSHPVVLGLVTVSLRPALRLASSIATIDELVVGSATRGTGVGADLLRAAVDEARRLGAARVELETRRSRESYVRGFYAKQGFVEVDSALFRIDFQSPRLSRW